ncbi:hypothetical protein FY534_04050 [Alicyclobacillus sp. TC]|uniref:Uncharacterized protein n=1 Tax=Alicyclobacillus tolerans TaxID=90970 RepID=A0A1M6SMB6_9BACL|nr:MULTISPECIES: hypothetical protein [Alicyclobacillus]QRF22941.1 hypothetical protein FY534_04050 [Alicyclobacillus sp. TC]SHK45862.1 hypothetical protein SAMN05443507_11428 [Alicyclobacillus montanus]
MLKNDKESGDTVTHVLLIILVVLAVLIFICLAILSFLALSVYFTLQPILSVLGRLAMVLGMAEWSKKWLDRWERRQHQRRP